MIDSQLIRCEEVLIDDRECFLFTPNGYHPGAGKTLYQLAGCNWSKDRGGWVVPKASDSQQLVNRYYGKEKAGESTIKNSRGDIKRGRLKSTPIALSKAAKDSLLAVEEQMRIQRYNWSTIKSYLSHLRTFFRDVRVDSPRSVTEMDIRRTVLDMVLTKQLSSSTQIQFLSAIRLWWEQVLGRQKIELQLQPRKEKKLPAVLSQQEVMRLFQAVRNLKHRCILMIIYSGGLRLAEACRLRIMDIHIDRGEIFVHGGKGKKDRFTTLSERILVQLRLYMQEYQPDYWLFEGQTGGAYSTRSVQAILRKAVKESGINPMATVHTLRHSYATHLLEQGVSLRHIQVLLGHESSKTTEIYTKVTNAERRKVSSPLDRLDDF